MRVPGIFWWPGRITAGTTQHQTASTMDVFTTVTRLAGATLPEDRIIDGRDISPLLFALKNAPPEDPFFSFFYYRGPELYAVRMGPWKAHFATRSSYGPDKPVLHDPPLLFHLGEDPGERWDRAGKHPEVIEDMLKAVAKHRSNLVPADSQLIEVE